MTEPEVPALKQDAEPHPIDRALAALADAIALVLASGKPSRFAEIGRLTTLAHKLGALRPAASVDDVPHAEEYDAEAGIMMANPMPMPIGRPFNDGADLNRQMIMLAQGFLREYAEIEKAKLSKPAVVTEGRLLEVSELSELFELKMKLSAAGQEVPAQIGQRIDGLLKRIGEPSHAPERTAPDDAALPAVDVRRHPPDGPGQPDGDRVGEPVADGA